MQTYTVGYLPTLLFLWAIKYYKLDTQISYFAPFLSVDLANWDCELNSKMLIAINLKKFAEIFMSQIVSQKNLSNQI